ncbi:bis(5'-nucleosyl)-tetraphosphatase (symmetrical) YqeK [Anaerobacillus sp. MEB173]|uniref:bis(5'-nucleosyl)-tetraphosphatase (symmetrical) YqeK n=1 Tax=Anaerobacillus sp. MEB173 TaxID=3383345 RepID=UPI003F8FE48A
MQRNKALEIVKEHLTEHRYQHTIGVTDTAVILAQRFGADIEKAEIAGIFHDYAKFRPINEMIEVVKKELKHTDILAYSSELLHAPVGAYLVQKEVGIADDDVLNAIRYHTTGRVGMTTLEKVVFLADYIEPGRHFPGVDEVRLLAKDNLDEAVIQSLINTISFLMKKKQKVYPETLATYNELISQRKN